MLEETLPDYSLLLLLLGTKGSGGFLVSSQTRIRLCGSVQYSLYVHAASEGLVSS
jgi:hypothetical protein